MGPEGWTILVRWGRRLQAVRPAFTKTAIGQMGVRGDEEGHQEGDLKGLYNFYDSWKLGPTAATNYF